MVTTDYPPRALDFIRDFVSSHSREEVSSLSIAAAGPTRGRQARLGWPNPANRQPAEEEGALRRA